MTVSYRIILITRNISDKSCRESQNARFMSDVLFFSWKSWPSWDNAKKYGRARQDIDDDTIRRMRIVCRITKAKSTHSEYGILITCPPQQ